MPDAPISRFGIEEARGPEETLIGEQRACHLVFPRDSGDEIR